MLEKKVCVHWCTVCGQSSESADSHRPHCQGYPAVSRLFEGGQFSLLELRRALEYDERCHPEGLTIKLEAGHNNINATCPTPGQIVKDRRIAELEARIEYYEGFSTNTLRKLREELKTLRKRPAHEFRDR